MLFVTLISIIVLPSVCLGSAIEKYDERSPKFLFLFPFYRVLPGLPCTTKSNLEGICLSPRQCNARKGLSSDSCGYKGVCCVYQRTCDESSIANNTYFISPNYPAAFNSGKSCSVTIEKINSGICQLRVDFLEFSIGEPDATSGVCSHDKLNLGIPNGPPLCGENGGHHVYLDFPAGSKYSISVTTVNALSMNRRWNLKISQIACNSSERAPSGCLKFFTSEKGSDRSFNFSPTSPTSPTSGSRNRMITDMSYGVCVRRISGFCGIKWSRSSANSYTFTMSGATNISDTTGPGSALAKSENCTSNFILIPNGKQSTGESADRYCGNNLPPITTYTAPFVMTVVASFNETNTDNRGFLLDYSQIPCEDGNK